LRRFFQAEWYLSPSSAHKSAFLLDHFLVLTALIIIKPTTALNRGDTFVFGSWVCIASATSA
jgi:hypothetical protein